MHTSFRIPSCFLNYCNARYFSKTHFLCCFALKSELLSLNINFIYMKYDGNFFTETCWDTPRDVMFVYDSPAIGIHRSKIIRKAITEMYKLMLIGSNKTRAGVLSHYCPTDLDTGIQDFQNEQSFLQSVKRQPNDGLRRLLRVLRTRSFPREEHIKKPVKKVGIIFLDREEHDSRDVIEEARRTALTSRLFVITIGNRVASHAVESLCSDFKHRCVFHVPQYNSLVQYVPDIMDMVCYS